MVSIVNLSETNFLSSEEEVLELKRINFFYGKNGTGKSTLCTIIREQLKNKFDVRIFQGFESVLGENRKLNAVILGEENNKIQEQIDEKEGSIKKIDKQINDKVNILNGLNGEESTEKNPLLLNYEKISQDLESKAKEISLFCTDSARKLTKQFNLGRTYDKNKFYKEIPEAQKLTDEEKDKLEKTINETAKEKNGYISLPKANLELFLKSVNEILQKKVEPKIIVEELENDGEKQEFAKKGLELHEGEDFCTFCGGKITESRRNELKTYFEADEVVELQERVEKGMSKIKQLLEEVKNIKTIDQKQFYAQFDVKDLNQELEEKKREYTDFLIQCKNKLDIKQKNLFKTVDSLNIETPNNFMGIQKQINDFIDRNNNFTQNIDGQKEDAERRLRLNSVSVFCEQGNYDSLTAEQTTLSDMLKKAKENLDNEIGKIKSEKKKIEEYRSNEYAAIKELQTKIKNPEIITQRINSKLKDSGHSNLRLKYNNQEKHYQILNDDETTRDITEISTGEKNIISFLYFIASLDSLDLETGAPKLIIFDDPMSSNDDTMQYLIITEIEKLYNKKNFYEHFILLTHNSHFYLKASFDRKRRRDGKNPYEIDNFVRMNSDGKSTTFKYLTDEKEDFSTQYGSLWKELKFLFDHDKKDFMCNTIRRIIETYTVFNGVKGNKHAESKLLFNTNSHSTEVGDLETDTNGYTREQIIEFLKQYFKQHNAEVHFNSYWKSK
ncbi:AAA family ATPase [Tetragenococcus halophilus]|uniref:AAA family ATPase n=1 Tax=Tetragenococcus halophilus TaxID=51669 RepID=A0AB37D222_TETHA|nr:AAA family ATPase [Tetragenococcus halophilus]QGP76188.1 AAA family ATPase [Tetragenococcus halophilus]WJS82374.1 AAA family ATPase [Tetragenococcus halophilus]